MYMYIYIYIYIYTNESRHVCGNFGYGEVSVSECERTRTLTRNIATQARPILSNDIVPWKGLLP